MPISPSSPRPEWRDDVEMVSDDPDNRIAHHTIRTPEGHADLQDGRRPRDDLDHRVPDQARRGHRADREVHAGSARLTRRPSSRAMTTIGDRGILRGFVWGDQAGCWQHACCLMDVNELILRCYRQARLGARAAQASCSRRSCGSSRSMKGAKFDLIETGGGAASSTRHLAEAPRGVLPALRPPDPRRPARAWASRSPTTPAAARSGIEEHDRRQRLRRLGDAGPAQRSAATRSRGSSSENRRRLALIGGIDQFNILTNGTREEIREMVFKLFETVGYDGGYILPRCDHFFETPPENIRIHADAARECVY